MVPLAFLFLFLREDRRGICKVYYERKEECEMFEFINNPIVRKGFGIVSVIFTGISAVSGVLSEQKKNKEFEEMKKTLNELQNK